MPLVCGIKFRGSAKVYYFSPAEYEIADGDYVLVETARGRELGQVAGALREVPETEVVGELKPVLAKATAAELVEAERYRQMEAAAISQSDDQVLRHNLPMKIVGAEYGYDGSRLTLFFTSDKRVDFRDLVRELAHTFKTRIELRQIGVRDEAKLIGGVGKCGRPLCCATWLTHFSPVSIRMAKQQDLPLSPMEISGICGRLLCCLCYEDDFYRQVKGRFPRVGKTVDTPLGPARVIKVSVFSETVRLLFEDGSIIEVTAAQLNGEEPMEPAAPTNGVAARSLDNVLGPVAPAAEGADRRRERPGERPQPAGPAPEPEPDREARNRAARPPRREPLPSAAPAGAHQQAGSVEASAEESREEQRSRRRPRPAGRDRRRPTGESRPEQAAPPNRPPAAAPEQGEGSSKPNRRPRRRRRAPRNSEAGTQES
jgi:cell fate regulator YaaT (PSP1 superfamily)